MTDAYDSGQYILVLVRKQFTFLLYCDKILKDFGDRVRVAWILSFFGFLPVMEGER